jgi:hypothetical protein
MLSLILTREASSTDAGTIAVVDLQWAAQSHVEEVFMGRSLSCCSSSVTKPDNGESGRNSRRG